MVAWANELTPSNFHDYFHFLLYLRFLLYLFKASHTHFFTSTLLPWTIDTKFSLITICYISNRCISTVALVKLIILSKGSLLNSLLLTPSGAALNFRHLWMCLKTPTSAIQQICPPLKAGSHPVLVYFKAINNCWNTLTHKANLGVSVLPLSSNCERMQLKSHTKCRCTTVIKTWQSSQFTLSLMSFYRDHSSLSEH